MTKDETLKLALDFVASISPAFICEATHHKKNERHADNEPCPHVKKQKQTYEAIKEALAQPEQKPMHPELRKMLEDYFDKCFAESAPQRTWVGLTDEEIEALASWWPSYDQMPAIKVLIKDVTNSLKEKNA